MTGKSKILSAGVEELLKNYAEAAVAHRQASREGLHRVANKSYKMLAEIVAELETRGADSKLALLSLLDDPRIEVRGWAAAHSLDAAPDCAFRVLQEIASGPESLEEFSARIVLDEWRAGRLNRR